MSSLTDIALRAPLFRGLGDGQILPLISRGIVKEAGRGASIHLQGERAHSLFIVLEGWVKLYRMSPCGSEAVVSVLTREDTFGECAAVPGEVYATGAVAVTDARLLQIDCRDLWHAMDDDVVMCRAFLGASLNCNRALVHQVEQLKSHTAAQRIADFLLGLCKTDTGGCTVVLPYDKVLIAGWLGMKPESLSRAFRRLSKHGVKIVKDCAIIDSVEGLAAFTDEDPSTAWNSKTCRAS